MPGPSVEEMRARMARIRMRAKGKASRLGAETRQFLDWKHYVRLYPWATLALAAVAGYLLVPRWLMAGKTAPRAPTEPARRDTTGVPPEREVRRGPGLARAALGVVGTVLLRAGIAWAGQQVGRMLASRDIPTETHSIPFQEARRNA